MSKSKKPIKNQEGLDKEIFITAKKSKKRSLKFTPNKKPKYNIYKYLSEEE